VWSEGGRLWCHSIEGPATMWVTGARLEERASQRIKIKSKTATTEIWLPKEDTIFQERNASG